MITTSFFELLKDGSPQQRQEFAQTLPPHPFSDQLVPLLATGNRGLALIAFAGPIISYCHGSAPEVGAALAFDAHRYAVELYTTDPSSGLIPTTLSGFASAYVNAANLMGRSEDVVDFTDQYISFYTEIGEPINLRSLKLGRASALLNLHRLDEAAAVLDDPTLPGNPATDIEWRRLRDRLVILRANPTEMAGMQKRESTDPLADARDVIALAAEGVGAEDIAQQLLAAMDASERLDPSKPADFARLLESLRQGDSLLTRGQQGDSEISIRARIREASGIFVMEKQPAREKLQNSLADLQECLTWARSHGMLDLQNDALWGIYLCYGRLNEPSPAADALLALRANLEKTRAGVTDPLKRGGAFSTYPHLFAALCEKLHAAGRYHELLEAMEASKGRAVADLLTQRTQQAVDDSRIYGAVTSLATLCQQHTIHYLTYFVDDECTYAVLISKHGALYTSPPIPLKRALIRSAAAHVDPARWGMRAGYGSKARIASAAEVLTPLVSWLGPLLHDGYIEADDHLCVSADDDLANVPFAYLLLDGKPLIETLSISRIHNAYHLTHVVAGAAVRPSRYLGVMVPLQQDVQRTKWVDMRRALLEPLDLLATCLPGETLLEQAGTAANLLQRELSDRVLHFSTHGVFPLSDSTQSPFESSGLVLAQEGALPDGDSVARGHLDGLLTPRRFFEGRGDLAGSHVSLMACVSGLTREGIGGDALGLDWVFIQAHAASVLSTHWYVSAAQASVFFRTFYHHWLVDKKTRAAAMRATVADMRAQAETSEQRAWAAFSLTGDWR